MLSANTLSKDTPINFDDGEYYSSDDADCENSDVEIGLEKYYPQTIVKNKQLDTQPNIKRSDSRFNSMLEIESDTHIMSSSLIRVHNTISNFLTNPTKIITFRDLSLPELPDIVRTLNEVSKFVIENCDLKSLKNLPKIINDLDVNTNNLTKLIDEELPPLLQCLDAHKNQIDVVNLGNSKNIKVLNLAFNNLKYVSKFPPNLYELNLSATDFSNASLLSVLTNLSVLKLNDCSVTTLDELPDSINQLYATHLTLFGGVNKAERGLISRLPKNLTKFKCQYCGVKRFGFTEFPKGLMFLDLYDNNLEHLPTLPIQVDYVDVSKNFLKSISNVPQVIETSFSCTNNPELRFTPQQELILNNLEKTSTVVVLDIDRNVSKNNNSMLSINQRSIYEPPDSDLSNEPIIIGSKSNSNAEKLRTQIDDYFDSLQDTKHQHVLSTNLFKTHTQRNNLLGNGSNNTPLTNRLNNRREVYPPHIEMLIRGDGFVPTKNRRNFVIHKHCYTV